MCGVEGAFPGPGGTGRQDIRVARAPPEGATSCSFTEAPLSAQLWSRIGAVLASRVLWWDARVLDFSFLAIWQTVGPEKALC